MNSLEPHTPTLPLEIEMPFEKNQPRLKQKKSTYYLTKGKNWQTETMCDKIKKMKNPIVTVTFLTRYHSYCKSGILWKGQHEIID